MTLAYWDGWDIEEGVQVRVMMARRRRRTDWLGRKPTRLLLLLLLRHALCGGSVCCLVGGGGERLGEHGLGVAGSHRACSVSLVGSDT